MSVDLPAAEAAVRDLLSALGQELDDDAQTSVVRGRLRQGPELFALVHGR